MRTHTLTYIVGLRIEPLVISGDNGRLYLPVSGNAVGLRAEGEEGVRGIAGAGELELGQIVNEEVDGGSQRTEAVLNMSER